MFCIMLMLNLLFFTALAAAQENDKSYLLTLNYKKLSSAGSLSESLSLVKLEIADGASPDYSLQPANGYILEIVSGGNKVLKSTKFSVPLSAVMLKGFTNEQAQGTPDNLDFTISVPYFSNAKSINIYDKDNINKVLEIPLDTKSQPEALPLQVPEEQEESSANLNWVYIAALAVAVVGLFAYVEIERKKGHKDLHQQRQQQNTSVLRSYAIANLRKGYSKEQIRNALAKNNYREKEIEEALRGV